MKEDRLLLVQFLHPGGEAVIRGREPGIAEWNASNSHHRKFLKAKGKYLVGNRWKEDDLLFWGEWEPQSAYTPIKNYSNDKRMPSGIHTPLLDTKRIADNRLCKNTDPCVFGEQFIYRCCQQAHNGRPAQLSRLKQGSIILFGSCIDKKQFVVDTVFVVRNGIAYSQTPESPELQGIGLDLYLKVARIGLEEASGENTISCVKNYCSDDKGNKLRLYYGATPELTVNGMYSFVPCKPYSGNECGFSRPILTRDDMKNILEGSVTDTLTQGHKSTTLESLEQGYVVWDGIRTIFRRQGFLEGVAFQMPEDKMINV